MIAALFPLITTILDKVLPDKSQSDTAKLELVRLAQTQELAYLDADVKMALAQLDVNKSEAVSGGFSATWRPAVGWVCVVALAYVYLLHPLLPWVLEVCGVKTPPLPKIDTELLMPLVFGMLGLGGMRSFEKIKKVGK
jgi:hypothetical protein